MRFIGGSLKGITIHPKELSARPTTDYAKEGLFNILSNEFDFTDLRVLDLFSGSGNIGLEFASRGAPHVTCVEINHRHVAFIKKTSQQLNLDAVRVVRLNVFDFLYLCTESYNIIFADPPYNLQGIDTLPQRIMEKQLLSPSGLLILEHSVDFNFTETAHFIQTKRYGNVHFSFFR
ncbi:MAG: RsmD family RNA methyltransferase [Prevotellaceae bacterium]|jgi:16S rRNA (guanine(966)-N(2))-methyltransferase RsmD|nr:RsmD family RNA methyltransferase [Prevotellaceae bacterium]